MWAKAGPKPSRDGFPPRFQEGSDAKNADCDKNPRLPRPPCPVAVSAMLLLKQILKYLGFWVGCDWCRGFAPPVGLLPWQLLAATSVICLCDSRLKTTFPSIVLVTRGSSLLQPRRLLFRLQSLVALSAVAVAGLAGPALAYVPPAASLRPSMSLSPGASSSSAPSRRSIVKGLIAGIAIGNTTCV